MGKRQTEKETSRSPVPERGSEPLDSGEKDCFLRFPRHIPPPDHHRISVLLYGQLIHELLAEEDHPNILRARRSPPPSRMGPIALHREASVRFAAFPSQFDFPKASARSQYLADARLRSAARLVAVQSPAPVLPPVADDAGGGQNVRPILGGFVQKGIPRDSGCSRQSTHPVDPRERAIQRPCGARP
jgi:hypothetical protein